MTSVPSTFLPARSMQEARIAATTQGLEGVFDANEIFCSGLGFRPAALDFLSLELSLYLKSRLRLTANDENNTYWLRNGASFDSYLAELDSTELGYLINDIMTELFWKSRVLERNERISRNANNVEVMSYSESTSSANDLVRRKFEDLSFKDIHLMLHSISGHLHNLYMRGSISFDSTPHESWAPSSSSHYAILSQMKINLSRSDALHLFAMVKSYPRRHASIRGKDLLRSINLSDRPSSVLGSINEDEKTDAEVVQPSETTHTGFIDSQSKRNTKRSSYSDIKSFVTALTHRTDALSRWSYATAQTRPSKNLSGIADKGSTTQTSLSYPTDDHWKEGADSSKWSQILRERDIVSDPDLENWSQGRGQHAEYTPEERGLLPLQFESTLGRGATAIVQSVLCKRVRLVRKVIICNKRTRLNREDAIQEIQQLYKAQHTHIVRLVGTYVIGDELAILTYPCAAWNLEEFLVLLPTYTHHLQRWFALQKFFTCLIRVMDFVHSFPIKHMDIKPQNILVRVTHRSTSETINDDFKVYLADFGSSRFYASVEETETDNWTPFTRTYAAKEVVLQETRGLSADVFSMGCVFTEMLAGALDVNMVPEVGLTNKYRKSLMEARSGTDGKPRPYYLKLESVCRWLVDLPIPETQPDLQTIRAWTSVMLNEHAALRPTAREIANDPTLSWPCTDCKISPGPERFEAASPSAV